MYKDLKSSPFYKNAENPYNRTQVGKPNPYYKSGTTMKDSEVRYGFESGAANKYSLKHSDDIFDSLEDQEYEYEPKQKHAEKRSVNLKEYDDEHFFKHEEECEVCDYIELFQNMDRQKLSEMVVFSEVIGKPKALKKDKI